ncbi:MAG TPA: sugar transferase [Flavobacterium sp.]|jgi:lipopolysaccharide/colanic/teichoic acid biosynthesis glycosyltransferase
MTAKRFFDLIAAIVALLLTGWLILLLYIIQSISTRSSGMFIQTRIGQFGKHFKIYKLRTIHPKNGNINNFSQFLRSSKLDELPQILNIVEGTMSFVGPRPDIPGYYDKLTGEAVKVLELKPGLTSEASLKYRDEEALLLTKEDPLRYNDEVIFPDKVKMNLEYYYQRSLALDIKIIIRTIFSR